MKKAYRFDGIDQMEALVNKYGRNHFDFIPDSPGHLDNYPHKGGYMYHDSKYSSWTSGEPDRDAKIVTFKEAMGSVAGIEQQIELAKSYIGKQVEGFGNYIVEQIHAVVSKEDAYKLGVASNSVLNDIDNNGFSVVISGGNFANPVMSVKIKPDSVKIKLNDTYDADVTKDTIVVGCQTYPISILDELIAARKSLD
jgi:hypothetical protein